MNVASHYLGYLRTYRDQIALILVGLLLELAFYSSLPLSFHVIIDRAIVPRDGRLLTLVLADLAGGFAITALHWHVPEPGAGRLNLSQTLPSVLQAVSGLRRIDELLEQPVAVSDAPHAMP